MSKNNIELPPLPPMRIMTGEYRASDMHEYARAAIEADRQRRGEPVAWVARSPGRTPQYFDGARAAHVYCGTGEWTISPLYDAPQSAEPVKVPSDDEVLEAMRPSLDEGDGGYICDMSPMHVIASGRALLARYGSKS